MPTRHIWRPRVIIFVVASLILIAAVITIIVKSTLAMNWQASPVVSMGRATLSAPTADMGVVTNFKSVSGNSGIMMPVPAPTGGATPQERAQVGPKIIRNASLDLRVASTDNAITSIKNLVQQTNGYVDSLNLYQIDNQNQATLSIRVPGDKLDETTTAVKHLATTVLNESTNAQDVTNQYVDLQSRLTAANAEEAQYLQILKQAKSVQDIISVQPYLNEVRQTIEQLQGQLRYQSTLTDFASLTISLTEETKIQAPTPTWKPLETMRQAFQLLVVSLQALADALIIGAVIIIGLLLPIGLVLWFVIWLLRKIWRHWTKR